MARELIDIVLRLRKEGTALRDVSDDLKDVDKSAGKAKAGLEGIASSLGKAAAVVGTAAAAFYTLKKAYDFGKEGAAILQTRDSFDRLMTSLGAGPEVLGRLRDASLGTVDDMTLMSGTMMLVAGASDILAARMVEDAPRLMEIAKAAQKLNPSLGTTAEMYQSIATGVKRAQPLILDNLGLTLKVGEANEAYAESIGKTVEQLTAEEKSIAILEATLKAGDQMIRQVGGSTEAMGDSFAVADAQLKNATDTMKTKLTPVMADLADAIADGIVLFMDHEGVVKDAHETALKASDSYLEYADSLIEAGKESGILADVDADRLDRYVRGTEEASGRTKMFIDDLGLLTEEQYGLAKETDRVSEKWATFADALKATELEAEAERIRKLSEDTQDLAGNVELVASMMSDRAARAADDFKGSLDLLHMAISGEVGESYDAYIEKVGELDQALANGELSSAEYKAAIEEESAAFKENTNAIIFNIAQKQILDALEKGLIKDTNESGTAFDEANTILWTLADTLGLVDQETLDLMASVQDETQAMIDGAISADTYALRMGNAALESERLALGVGLASDEIRNMPDRKEFVLEFKTRYSHEGQPPPTGEGGPGYTPPAPPQMMQHGGQFIVRGPAGPDRVPVNFRATAGEVVTVTPVGGMAPSNPVTNNYNLTLNSAQNSQGVVSDFNIMQAMVG